MLRRLLFCTLSVLVLTGPVWSQSAQMTGRITDPSGAVVPDANVSVVASETGVRRRVSSNQEGYYTVPLLQPGRYEVVVQKDGFKAINRQGIELAVGEVSRLDFVLELGNTSEVVEVTASGPLLETENTTMGQVVGTRQVSTLPLLGRNPYALAALVPGVRASLGVNQLPVDQISTASASINGLRANQNEYLLDGAPNTAAAQNQPVVHANPDMVQEFKVETNSYSAEYGRAAGGVYNVVTKGGTNELHGSAYEFFRDTKLNANDFFANRAGRERAPFRFNQFGGTVGGPVFIPKFYDGRNRTFFFTSVELVRFSQGVAFTGTMPTALQKAGNFSETRNAAGVQTLVYDPASLATLPGGGFRRSAFANNIIPQARFNPVSVSIASFLPDPNTQGTGFTNANNWARTDSSNIDKNTYSVRFDHNFNENNRIMGRYSYDETPWLRAPAYGEGNPGSPGAAPQVFTRRNTSLEYNRILSPSFLSQTRASYSRLSNFREPLAADFQWESLGFPAGTTAAMGLRGGFPSVNITGFSRSASIPNVAIGGLLGSQSAIAFGMDQYALQQNFTKTLASHTVKFGGEYRLMRFATTQFGDQAAVFNFTPNFTQGANPSSPSGNTGVAMASFLLGLPGGGSVTPSPALALQNLYYGFYVQDAWKVTPRLTLNMGVRWEMESPRTERFNQLTNFDFNAAPPLNVPDLNLHGALAFVGVDGIPRYQTQLDKNNVSPRLGIAYQLSDRVVIRTGAGIFYASTTGIGGSPGDQGISGFQTSTNMVTSLDGITPYDTLSNPYPQGYLKATGSSLGAATLLGQGISFFDRGNVTPYSAQWNFNIQTQMPGNILLETGYVGTRGLKMSSNQTLNQLPDEVLSLGDGLRRTVPNPFRGQILEGALSQKNVSVAQLLRPYPQFQGVTANNRTFANSSYHALQIRVERRFDKGLTLLGSYAFSKTMDLFTGPFSGEPLSAGGIQNWNNLAADWGVSFQDQTHRLLVNGIYELPFFRTQNTVIGKVVGGWELGGVFSVFNGSPLGVSSVANNTFSQGGGQRPNWNGANPIQEHPTVERWLSADVFSNPSGYTFGNAPRTFGGTRAHGTSQVDLTLNKNTRIGEKYTVQFRTEFFNLLNSPVFNAPNVNFGNPQFGVVSSQQNQPRIIQFALKFLF
ncbi:MAG: TonB-dependent receptor [Bryobacterales bacterium]|nr:TonB-dependent receptor [Bryobacterales bacterium]